MKKRTIIFLIILIMLSTGGYIIYHYLMDSKEPVLDKRLYKTELDSLVNIRKQLKMNRAAKQTLKAAFIKGMTQKVFPYWYGTKWDFNGTTQMPQEGSIACGYFVTTTLRDMGVPVNRVKMAQCASEEMIRSLTAKKYIYYFSSMSLTEFEKKITAKGNGLYIIGLDNHTGFIYINNDEHYFIHSSGWFPFKVVKDKISKSDVLAKSNYRVAGKISDDDVFLKKWVEGE